MLYLYLGYIFSQSYAVIEKLVVSNIAPLAMFFSVVVFLLWSALPVAGYLLAKWCKAKGNLSNKVLVVCGFIFGVVENTLFHFNILSYGSETLATFMVFCLSFALAHISLTKPT